MSPGTLHSPQETQERLQQIDMQLAGKLNDLESAAYLHFKAKREKERQRAIAFLTAEGTVAERSAIADRDTAEYGSEHEATYEALRASVRSLEARSSIGMAILKAQSRVGA